jgi:hypothetical protein
MPELAQLFDAQRTRDPTRTLQLRKSFRATAKLQLRQLRAAMRVAVIDHNILGQRYQPPDLRLRAFASWLAGTGEQLLLGTQWARPYIIKAWRAGERDAKHETGHVAGPDQSEAIVALAAVEITGIINATVQQTAREAARVIARNTRRMTALRQLFKTFDKVAQPRLVVMCDVLAVKAYNEAKLNTYQAAGVRRVGIRAESLPHQHVRASTTDAEGLLPAIETVVGVIKTLEGIEKVVAEEEELVGILTAGDDKVCQLCEDYAEDAPYEIEEVRDVYPLHPRCRCAVYPWEDLRYKGDSIEDFDPSQPRDPKGSATGGQWTKGGGGSGYEFVSPNIGQGGLAEAAKELNSDRQRALQRASQEVDTAFGIKGQRHDAIGAWSDGAENTIVTTVDGNENWDKLRVSAAMKGHLADQKAVLIFKQTDDGASMLYRMHVPEGDVQKLHENLIKDGLAFHTIMPHTAGGGADVIVADLDGSAHNAMAKAAERYNADVFYETGQAEFIGTQKQDGNDREQRDDARRAYEEVIRESPVQASQEIWAGLHHTWGETLGLKAPTAKPTAAEPWGAAQGVVASRNITSKKSTFEGYARPDVDAMRQDPKNFEHDVGLFSNANAYPNFRAGELQGDANARVHTIVEHMKANIKFLYENASDAIKTSGMGWYDKAHNIAVTDAKTYGIDERSASAVIATLSPQKDWNQNIYLAHAVLEINHSQKDHVWDDEMSKTAERIWIPKLKKNASELQQKKFPEKLEAARKQVAAVQGKKLGELTDPIDKAVWIRTYDEAHSDRTYKDFDTGVQVLTKAGKPARAAWQSTPAIAAAVESMDSKGDLKAISEALGEKHKVRSFYNNIIAPHAPNGDVTVDTHAVGVALLRPASGKAAAVMQALATSPQGEKPPGWEASRQSKVTGIKGTYAIYADAYREVATELGILPQQLQAVTWQAKRELFSIGDKKKAEVEHEWIGYYDGKQTLKQTQQNILTIARSAPREESDDDD